MSRKEFLDTLRIQLEGTLTNAEIEGHLHYYNEYILDAVAAGRTEAEVTEELGSPVFIAKTLMDTAQAEERESERRESRTWEEGYGREEQTGQENYRSKVYHISPFVAKWVIPIAAIFVVVLLILLVSTILGAAIAVVARLFVPIMLVVLVIALFKKHG